MAKLIKVTGYLIATDDDIDTSEIAVAAKEILSSKFDCIGKPFKTETANIGEWSDDHELNSINQTASVCEKYFQTQSKWSEIRSNFYHHDEHKLYIDAWKSSSDNEEGTVIAKIDCITKEVEYLDEDAKTDTYAQSVIDKIKNRLE